MKQGTGFIVGINLIENEIIEGDINPLLKMIEEKLGSNWEQVIKNSLGNQELIEKGEIDDKIK